MWSARRQTLLMIVSSMRHQTSTWQANLLDTQLPPRQGCRAGEHSDRVILEHHAESFCVVGWVRKSNLWEKKHCTKLDSTILSVVIGRRAAVARPYERSFHYAHPATFSWPSNLTSFHKQRGTPGKKKKNESILICPGSLSGETETRESSDLLIKGQQRRASRFLNCRLQKLIFKLLLKTRSKLFIDFLNNVLSRSVLCMY